MRSPLFVFPSRQILRPRLRHEERFSFFRSDCRVASKQNHATCQSAPQVGCSTAGAEEKEERMNNVNPQVNRTEFTIEWKDSELTALKVMSGEKTSVVRFDSKASCLFEMDEQSDSCAILESLEDRFCELTGIRLDISNVFLNLLRVDHGSDVEQKMFFADFPDAAKDKFSKEIRKIAKSWRFKGDEVEREVKLKEFISYVIYFRRFFSFVGCDNALNVGLIYINKVWLEDEWLAFNQDTEALCQKLSPPATNGIVQYHLEEAKRLADIWRKPNNSSWKYFAKEVCA